MSKEELRKHYLARRMALSDDEYAQLNALLQKKLERQAHLTGAGPVHIFLPIRKFREADTWPIIRQWWQAGIATMTSITDIQQGTLTHLWFDASTEFQTNQWGIPEPTSTATADPALCSAVFVPLLVADEAGHRIGYGKGFYDVFLAKLPPSTLKIGLSLLPLVKYIGGIKPHDVPLDIVITADTLP